MKNTHKSLLLGLCMLLACTLVTAQSPNGASHVAQSTIVNDDVPTHTQETPQINGGNAHRCTRETVYVGIYPVTKKSCAKKQNVDVTGISYYNSLLPQ